MTNIELKARLSDVARAVAVVQAMGATFQGVLRQTDTYFYSAVGRLKLRETEGRAAELIGYARPDGTDPRASEYQLYDVDRPAELKALLAATLGVRVIVTKTRELHLWENVRLHFDHVDGLGTFFECEAVLRPGEDPALSHARVVELRRRLDLQDKDLIATGYGDLAAAAA